eukprot:TRINITY_DN4389_c0_g1_i1.p1 TRINITY_DN4389_c0_g1~~TRINITY_DN4389_c0_g1_i1.p1  ORF type:complete len:383 (+),score=58.87 TRINITY_DN4389_c0_g1_i1:162-1310(+)
MELIPGLSWLVRHFLAVLITVIGIVFLLSMFFLYDSYGGTSDVQKLQGFTRYNNDNYDRRSARNSYLRREEKFEDLTADLASLSFYFSTIKNSDQRVAFKTELPIIQQKLQVELLQRSGEFFRSARRSVDCNTNTQTSTEQHFLVLEDLPLDLTDFQYNNDLETNFLKYISFLYMGKITQTPKSFNSNFHILHFNTFSQSINDKSIGSTICSLFDKPNVPVLKNISGMPDKLFTFIRFDDYQVLLPGFGVFLSSGLSKHTNSEDAAKATWKSTVIDFVDDQKKIELKNMDKWNGNVVDHINNDKLENLVEKMSKATLYITDNDRNALAVSVLPARSKVVEVVPASKSATKLQEMCRLCGVEYLRFNAGREWSLEDLKAFIPR